MNYALAAVLGMMMLTVGLVAGGPEAPTMEIQVNNPYSFEVDVELQCDWDNDTQKYQVHQFLLFPAEKMITLRVPAGTKHCKIWPHVRLWE